MLIKLEWTTGCEIMDLAFPGKSPDYVREHSLDFIENFVRNRGEQHLSQPAAPLASVRSPLVPAAPADPDARFKQQFQEGRAVYLEEGVTEAQFVRTMRINAGLEPLLRDGDDELGRHRQTQGVQLQPITPAIDLSDQDNACFRREYAEGKAVYQAEGVTEEQFCRTQRISAGLQPLVMFDLEHGQGHRVPGFQSEPTRPALDRTEPENGVFREYYNLRREVYAAEGITEEAFVLSQRISHGLEPLSRLL